MLDTGVASQNVGDEIINNSIKMNWPELYDNNCIFRLPSHTPPYSWWQQLFFSKKIEAFENSKVKFLCGTNALYTNMMRPIPQWNVHLWNAHMYSNTVLLGVGAGINSSKINLYTRYLYSKLLSHKFIHSVRDEYTQNLLSKLGYKAINTGCPTLWGFVDDFCEDIPTKKTDSVVFTLTGYQPDRKNDQLMIEILKRNYSRLYFWPQTFKDLNYIQSLNVIDYEIIAPNLTAYDKLLSQDIDYVGNRLHGGIRALQHKKRAIIIAIDYRATNMHSKNSLPVIQREDIADKLDKMIKGESRIRITGIDKELINLWKSQF